VGLGDRRSTVLSLAPVVQDLGLLPPGAAVTIVAIAPTLPR
jgi:hypothetical protein